MSIFFTYLCFVDRLRGVTDALANTAYELVIYSVDSSTRRDGYLATLPITRRLDGLIVMPLPFDEIAARRLLTHGLTTVLIEAPQASFSGVEIDDHAGGRIAAEYLIKQGHRRCGFVGDVGVPEYAVHTSSWRLAGYHQALDRAGIGLPADYIALAPHGLEQARQQAHRLLDLPTPPTAIFAPSDTQALGVLKAARERGMSVPGDLAVMGFDDVEIADYVGLTTISQYLKESSRVAVEMLLARLADPVRPVQHVRLPLTVVKRETA